MTSKFGSDLFIDRHLGLGDNDERIMLNKLGFKNIDQFPSAPYFSKYRDLFLKPESTSKFWIKEQIRINKDL